MKLVMHLGTHKTGTTTFQRILSNNHYRLMENGIWWELEYPIHHHAAWEVMSGGHGTLDTMVSNARRHGCGAVIVSSEEFEGSLKFHGMLDVLQQAVRHNGITSIEWHVTLRNPGEYFASLYCELQKHFFQDLDQMYHDVRKKGYLHIDRPFADRPAPFCCFIFDYFRYLGEFRQQLAARDLGTLFVHDYTEEGPFPGWRILEPFNVIDQLDHDIPPLNVRDSTERVRERSAENFERFFGKSERDEQIKADFKDRLGTHLEHLPAYADSIAEIFAESHAKALAMTPSHRNAAGSGAEGTDWRFRSRRSRVQRLKLALRFVFNALR